ncbi:MAG: hypothetical protein DI529_14155 [Chryseobacterium sp.]|nr:MAG: hypothetical protein DI529_14155 [Chryseobacterium sp.]
MNKYSKLIINLIAIILSIIIGYICTVFSIFFFLGRHAEKKMNNELIITIGIFLVFIITITIIVYCIKNLWKILKKQ